ncbi:M23 family metallopeptidase [Aquibacillus rhizosphaerae]|uniref:M23 family metallopeptidase n=1 Tax=Aquibacillus rhizosphaerae TaxID=3051431 RepID=A0ABT7L3D8_9BACI|nr:M23 family metallopeptidase [Aquibacillus sp. LR5S19]MDL4840383.1 M23 family metallopeptidase [Aquibacillus sp. LR5S19]
MLLTIFQIIVIQLILPIFLMISLWKEKSKSKLEWIVQMTSTTLVTFWIFQSGRWDWIGYYLRYLLLILLIFAIYLSWKKVRHKTFRLSFNRKEKFNLGINVFLIIIFGMYNMFVLTSYTVQEETVELSFPLRENTYYVGQGGSHTQMNYHHAYQSQQYALDVVALNSFGIRASGLYPEDLSKYEIYGDALYSPCTGEVIESRRELVDLTPPDTNPDQPEGNYVAISCDNNDAIVYIAHMKQNSMEVNEGDTVQDGQYIGAVGNSGNTTEPHLHIHAEQDGAGVPIRFDGEFLTRNRLIRN